MRLFLAALLLTFSIVATSKSEYNDLYDQTATSSDLIHLCSAVNAKIDKSSVDLTNADSVDKAWAVVASRYQCLSFVTGVMAGNDLHTIIMNKKLNRDLGDTTYSNMCVPNIDQQQVIGDMVKFATTKFNESQLIQMGAAEFVYSYMGATYPCQLKDPL